jgi:hypothetical protein
VGYGLDDDGFDFQQGQDIFPLQNVFDDLWSFPV